MMDLELSYKVENQNVGQATYFRTVVRNYLINWAKENGYDLFSDGLKIYTTIDSRLQDHAEKAVHDQMKRLQSIFSKHWEGRNPWIDEKGFEINSSDKFNGFSYGLELILKRFNLNYSRLILNSITNTNNISINYKLKRK